MCSTGADSSWVIGPTDAKRRHQDAALRAASWSCLLRVSTSLTAASRPSVSQAERRPVGASQPVNNSNEHCQITPFKGSCWNVLNGAFSLCHVESKQQRYPQLTPALLLLCQLKQDQQPLRANGSQSITREKGRKKAAILIMIILIMVLVAVALFVSLHFFLLTQRSAHHQHNHYYHNHHHHHCHWRLCHVCLLASSSIQSQQQPPAPRGPGPCWVGPTLGRTGGRQSIPGLSCLV